MPVVDLIDLPTAPLVGLDLGEKTIGAARSAWQGTLARLMCDWPAEDRATLLRLLDRLSDDLGSVVQPG